MNTDQAPIARIRRNLDRIQDLYGGNLLTHERLLACLIDARRACDEAAEALRDDEHFELTSPGLQAIYTAGKPARYRGHLVVIDGDAS